MDTQSNEPIYKMTIGLSVLEHLGVGLYSNVPAVLSEAVANAWDADAENVRIDIDADMREIVIYDDGSGMTVDDINAKYLKVGYKKRESESNFGVTPKFERQPMGRKGIGKLSLFSIANMIEIHTVKGGEANALRMNSDDIRAKIKNESSDDYYPESLPSDIVQISQGTKIKLSGVKKRIDRTDEFLRKRLARRFSIIGKSNFSIEIDGHIVSARDRDYYVNIEYLWYFGDRSKRFVQICGNAIASICSSADVGRENGYRITGWIGTVKERKQINEDTNGIVIFANGKLVHEDILNDMKEGGVWTKYIIGEIDADFMDDSHEIDIITSARQRLKEDEPRYIALRDFLKNGVIREIASNWQRMRSESGARKVLSERKNITRWLDRLQGDQKESAKNLLGRIETLDVKSESEKVPFFKAVMYAFERLSVTQQLGILSKLETRKDFELISSIFGNLTDLTRVHYYDIAKVRVEIIKKFQEIIEDDKKERVIQEHIFGALWLLDPSWERAATNEWMEKTVMKEFGKVTTNLSQEEKRARIDIRYQTVTGSHVIVELKRYSAPLEFYPILGQLRKYKDALEKCLASKFAARANMPVATVCITGPRDFTEEERKHLLAGNVRWLNYDELIQHALLSYNDYLQAERRISDLVQIIDSIDEDFDD